MKQKNTFFSPVVCCCAATIFLAGTIISALLIPGGIPGSSFSANSSAIIAADSIDSDSSGSAVISHCVKSKNQNQFRRGENFIPTPFILSISGNVIRIGNLTGKSLFFSGSVKNPATPVRAGPENTPSTIASNNFSLTGV